MRIPFVFIHSLNWNTFMHQGLYAKNKPFARQKETLQFCQGTFSDHIYLQYIALNIFKKTRYFLQFWVVRHLKFKEYIKESFHTQFLEMTIL